MSVHIAIPEPTSRDTAYNQRSLPPYLAALHSAGVIPVLIPLHERPDRIARVLTGVQGVLLPGSGYDVEPEKYGEARIPECGEAEPERGAADELMLRHVFDSGKPCLGICFGAQALNVFCSGSLLQDLRTPVNHSPGRMVLDAHRVEISAGSRLAALVPSTHTQMVNSSHHQAVKVAGSGLRVTARSPEDGVIEAIELVASSQFVVGVQWHPERTYTHSTFSRSIFAAFVEAARAWQVNSIAMNRLTETSGLAVIRSI